MLMQAEILSGASRPPGKSTSTPVFSVPSSQRLLHLLRGSLWRRPSLSPSCPTRLPTSSLEATGIAAGVWVLSWILQRVAGFQHDEVYIGTAEKRDANNHADDSEKMHLGPGHPRKLPGFIEKAPISLQVLMQSDPSVEAYLTSMHGMENGEQKKKRPKLKRGRTATSS
jgi:hypothetical protein